MGSGNLQAFQDDAVGERERPRPHRIPLPSPHHTTAAKRHHQAELASQRAGQETGSRDQQWMRAGLHQQAPARHDHESCCPAGDALVACLFGFLLLDAPGSLQNRGMTVLVHSSLCCGRTDGRGRGRFRRVLDSADRLWADAGLPFRGRNPCRMQDAVDFSWLRRCRAWVAVPIADEAIDGCLVLRRWKRERRGAR